MGCIPTQGSRPTVRALQIKFIYNGTNYTIPEYLKANGMSVEEYLNPSWSNTMERIAIQRVIEWSDTRPVNRRPNGELWYRAGLNGINTNREVFAQGASDIGAAIDYFGSCKPAFIDGQSTGDVTEEYIVSAGRFWPRTAGLI